MKKITIAFLSLLLLVSNLHAQNIGSRTLVYGEEVRLERPLHVDSNDSRPIEEQLDEQLAGTDIQYKITPRHILLYCQRLKEIVKKSTRILSGYVVDASSKETLIGANIFCHQLDCGASTNAYGYFTLPLIEGNRYVTVSYVGYEPQIISLDMQRDSLVQIEMIPTQQLQEVIVDSDRPETGVRSTRLGATSLSQQQIKRTPALLGEPDVIKSLQRLSGVQPGFSGTSQISVRGGNLDQNLYLLDGVLLYNVHHVLGFESAFMPDAVKNVDFYRSSFPSRYGGRLSSVTDVRTKDGDMQHYHGLFSIGLLSSHIALEGPIVKDRTSFIISGRRSYVDWLARLVMNIRGESIDKLSIYFYDVNAKVNHRFSDTDRIYFSFYRGEDGLKIGEKSTDNYTGIEDGQYIQMRNDYAYLIDMHWGNTFYNARWNHLYTPSLFSNLTVGYNRFQMISSAKDDNVYYQNKKKVGRDLYHSKFGSGVDDLMAIYDFDYHPDNRNHIKVGGSYTLHKFNPEVWSSGTYFYEDGTETKDDYHTDRKPTYSHEPVLYAEDDITLPNDWQINAGLRAIAYCVKDKCYPAVEPRFSVSHLVAEGFRAKASYAMMHQYVIQLTTSPINMPSDLWVTVNKDLKPMVSQQWSLGLATDRWKGWEFSVETYWKQMRHVLDYVDGTSFYGSSDGWENKVSSGEGRCYGVEFSAARTIGTLTGNFNYSLSHSERQYKDCTINAGNSYPFEYCSRHVINASLFYQISKRVDVSASWYFASGGYGTVSRQHTKYIYPETNNYDCGEITKYYSSRNNYQLHPRHQLDLSVNLHHKTRHGERTWNFSLINAYAHRNQDIVWTEEEEDDKTVLKQMCVIPFLPSISYSYKF